MGSDEGGRQVAQWESGLSGQLAERTNGLQLGPVGRDVQIKHLRGRDRPMAAVRSARPGNQPLLSGP